MIWTQTAHVPAEVWTDRIGFVMIQIDEDQKVAELLGFTPIVETEEFPLSQLQPMTALVDRLEALQPATFSIPVLRSSFSTPKNTLANAVISTVTNIVEPTVTRISDWFHETLEGGWQSVESLALPPAFAFRLREPQRAATRPFAFVAVRSLILMLRMRWCDRFLAKSRSLSAFSPRLATLTQTTPTPIACLKLKLRYRFIP